MPRVRIDVDDVLPAAVATYQAEVEEILDVIRLDAASAGVDPERYFPPDFAHESEALDIATQAIQLSATYDPAVRLMGVELTDDQCRVMVSALLIRRDDLMALAERRAADALAPPVIVRMLQEQIRQIDQRLESAYWARLGPSLLLPQIRERRAVKRGSAFPKPLELPTAVGLGEGQEIEFMERFPAQAHELAKEIAAFGSTNPGTIWLGVSDDGEIVGLERVESLGDRDALQTRVEGVCANSVTPPLIARTIFEDYDGMRLLRIEVPKGSEPVYYSNRIPYVRHGSLSRPAAPAEVTERVRRWLSRWSG